jgi:branched-chain amino acid transport system substrate-binding protein
MCTLRQRSLHLLSAIGSGLLCFVVILSPVSALSNEPIRIGVIDAFSGPAAAFGEPALMGWKMAVAEINASGGLHGRKIELVARDDEFTEEKAAVAARELILKDEVDFLGGTSSSTCALAVSEIAREHGKIFMVHIARSDRITGEKGHRYVFRACPNSLIEGKSGARYAKHKKYLKWFIVGEDYEYGRSIAQGFWEELHRLVPNAEKLGEIWVPLKTADYSSFIRDIMAREPTAIFVAFGVSGMTRFLKQAEKAGLLEKRRVFLNLMADPVLIADLGDTPLSENAFGSTSYLWSYPDTPENKDFVQKYTRFAGSNGGSSSLMPPGFAFFGGYCSARFLAEAMKKTGSSETESVIAALEGMTIATPVGPIEMRSCDHQAVTPTYWGRIQNAKGFSQPLLLAPSGAVAKDLLPACNEIGLLRK